MEVAAIIFHRLCHVEIRRLLPIIGTVVAVVVVFQCFALPYRRSMYLSVDMRGSAVVMVYNATTIINNSRTTKIDGNGAVMGLKMDVTKPDHSSTQEEEMIKPGQWEQMEKAEDKYKMNNHLKSIPTDGKGDLDANLSIIASSVAANILLVDNVKQVRKALSKNTEPLKTVSIIMNNNSTATSISVMKRMKIQPTSVSQMNSLLLRSLVTSSHSMRSRLSSMLDHELLSAKHDIQNAPVVRNTPEEYASIFRNVSMFKREGEKPIFHQSKTRGIYASEGWFMKLIEGNRKFTVKNPRKAHLFYLPFSSQMLRTVLSEQDLHNQKELEIHLKKYLDLIARKYNFWNRTGGADHFLVACHDWAPKITRRYMKNCIRSLCNANIAKDFKIGKDTTLPVTYVHSAQATLEDLGGKPPSERPILAFFAGSMHGYLRPMLLKFWENKEADMKIFGPLPRDLEGKKMYREYMKNSKYCICARGYEVHTPRVVEAILNECVPVILSDNYVPPFFEVFDWEAFSVFVQEREIPNLRNILLSIPEEKYRMMQLRIKLVQQHFLWHKKPVKYDLFHMILHAVWYNRVFQIRAR
ncbi:probable glycosyltransferase At5g03795 isoform X2 [Tripterygium wilfordii]|uniref:probable glycosyltransferase At5g03795 isoform X2 n=1 Tax=Tripterygium wilfordii TaxID=458696 RepID=UPI0018F82C50|nr:probable glycosyltransferase At5g03795 isoform X2 [Tripterygium wilfordii]